MTEEELKTRIKEKFESICNKLFQLEHKYECVPEVKSSLMVIAASVGTALGRVHLPFTQEDHKYPNLLRTFLNARPCYSQNILPPMSLQECADFMERADKALDAEEKILELAQQLKKEGKA